MTATGAKVLSGDWVHRGEKYALVGLRANIGAGLQAARFVGDISALTTIDLEMPEHWKEWLGTIRNTQVSNCNLFLVSTSTTETPEIFDAENENLKRKVTNFYFGLLLAAASAPFNRPILLTGSRLDEIGIRQQSDFPEVFSSLVDRAAHINGSDLELAARLAFALSCLSDPERTGRSWRLIRCLTIYVRARNLSDHFDRLHQYARVIEGLILPDIGKTRRQFMSRTELFIGGQTSTLMGEIFDVRSAVEHLHEDRYLLPFDRDVTLDVVRKEAVAGFVARRALQRVLLSEQLRGYFGSKEKLAEFWRLSSERREQMWGAKINALDAIAGFDPTYISDHRLGGPR